MIRCPFCHQWAVFNVQVEKQHTQRMEYRDYAFQLQTQKKVRQCMFCGARYTVDLITGEVSVIYPAWIDRRKPAYDDLSIRR